MPELTAAAKIPPSRDDAVRGTTSTEENKEALRAVASARIPARIGSATKKNRGPTTNFVGIKSNNQKMHSQTRKADTPKSVNHPCVILEGNLREIWLDLTGLLHPNVNW